MNRGELLVIAMIAATITLATCQEAIVTKCWKCSSDARDTEFCGDPFFGDQLNDTQKALYYIDCTTPVNRESPRHNQKNVCRKLKQKVNGTIVVHRSCFWQEVGEGENNLCANINLPESITNESCELCADGNGCNGAIQFGSIAMFVAVPMAVAKLLFL